MGDAAEAAWQVSAGAYARGACRYCACAMHVRAAGKKGEQEVWAAGRRGLAVSDSMREGGSGGLARLMVSRSGLLSVKVRQASG